GKVTSDQITATIVVIAGIVKGNITAEKVEIRATGRVWGDITTSAFATQEGAFLRGQVRMEEHIELEFIDEEEFDEGDSKGLSETGVESALAAQEEAETTAPPAGVVIEVEKMGLSSIESAQSDSGDGAGGQYGEPEEPPAAGGAVRQAKKEKKS
ncbi:MAG TPA: polymer-forming cytoskeletal protein, partial [Anaerolineales bacterium]|nr:polymer-forming cytoskeletal protein [Anaerolineales bacterium]